MVARTHRSSPHTPADWSAYSVPGAQMACAAHTRSADALSPETVYSPSVHSVAACADMALQRAQMERALGCTLSELRQKAHWGNAAVRLAAVLSLYYEDPLDYVDTAVWGTVRADKRRVEDLHERLAHESAPLLLLSSAAEALVDGI